MNKIILTVTLIFITFFSAQAQTDSETPNHNKVTFGLRTGYEFQANKSNLDYELKLPFLGVLSDFRLSNNWSLQLELNLRSEHREELFSNGSLEAIDELYFTVPVLLKYHIKDKLKVYAGTQVLSASLKTDVLGIKKWNGILGVEYNLTKKVFLDARFRHGFEEKNDLNNFRDNRISIGIGYKF